MPFDEDDRDDSVWFLDHDYLENMYGMFKKVNGEALICCVSHDCVTLILYLSITVFPCFQPEKE